MPNQENRSLFAFYIIVLIMSIGSLIVATQLSPLLMEQIIPFITIGLFIALLEFFPLDLLNYRYSFVHIIIFSGAVLYGTGVAAYAALSGIVLAIGLQIILPKALKSNFSTIEPSAKIGLFELGLNLTPLVLAFSIFGIALEDPLDGMRAIRKTDFERLNLVRFYSSRAN